MPPVAVNPLHAPRWVLMPGLCRRWSGDESLRVGTSTLGYRGDQQAQSPDAARSETGWRIVSFETLDGSEVRMTQVVSVDGSAQARVPVDPL